MTFKLKRFGINIGLDINLKTSHFEKICSNLSYYNDLLTIYHRVLNKNKKEQYYHIYHGALIFIAVTGTYPDVHLLSSRQIYNSPFLSHAPAVPLYVLIYSSLSCPGIAVAVACRRSCFFGIVEDNILSVLLTCYYSNALGDRRVPKSSDSGSFFIPANPYSDRLLSAIMQQFVPIAGVRRQNLYDAPETECFRSTAVILSHRRSRSILSRAF